MVRHNSRRSIWPTPCCQMTRSGPSITGRSSTRAVRTPDQRSQRGPTHHQPTVGVEEANPPSTEALSSATSSGGTLRRRSAGSRTSTNGGRATSNQARISLRGTSRSSRRWMLRRNEADGPHSSGRSKSVQRRIDAGRGMRKNAAVPMPAARKSARPLRPACTLRPNAAKQSGRLKSSETRSGMRGCSNSCGSSRPLLGRRIRRWRRSAGRARRPARSGRLRRRSRSKTPSTWLK
mmetsp:Transcript_38534/g.68958  ORF Transcript_38534/g.68958 Transcript_38534/m.68958 type:complete len:235 (-) Transcript_38534:1901-2605(-)